MTRRQIKGRRRMWAGAGLSVGAAFALPPSAEAATIEVTSLADDGTGGTTLREAVEASNATAAVDDVITFQSGLTGAVNLDGSEITITDAVEINGPGASVVTVDGNDDTGIFLVDPADDEDLGMPVGISGLTLTRGNGFAGAAIWAPVGVPTVTVTGSVLTDNHSTAQGGAIAVIGGNIGGLTVEDSTLTGNGAQAGGAILSVGRLSVEGSTLTGNTASNAGAILAKYQQATIEDSVLSGNTAEQSGGAIAATSPLAVLESTISENSASLEEGGGGGIYAESGVTVRRSTIAGNDAYAGGGIASLGPDDASSSLFVNTSTITGNDATAVGGGIYSYTSYQGNGLGGSLTVRGSTIAGNDASDAGGGIFRYDKNDASNARIDGTIVAGNSADEGPDLDSVSDDNGLVSLDVEFTLIEDPSDAAITGPANHLILNQDPLLGPLADNGGPTETMLPAPTSPVIDQSASLEASIDQRGFPRTVDLPAIANLDDSTDIGAVELGVPPPPTPPPTPAAAGPAVDRGACNGKVPTILGTPGDDVIKGTSDRDVIRGLAGEDKIRGRGGKDLICGGSDDDTVKGGAGPDTLIGGAGSDALIGGPGIDALFGGTPGANVILPGVVDSCSDAADTKHGCTR